MKEIKLRINTELLKKVLKPTGIAVLCAGVLIGGFCGWLYGAKIKPEDVTYATVGDGKTLKVGVISDTQLQPKPGESLYSEHLQKALEELKEQEVDMIIHAGDVGDMNSFYSYNMYNKIFERVYGADEAQHPQKLYIMGNHDMWWNTDYNTANGKHRKWSVMLGENPNTHQVVNGFHFIGVSPDKGSTLEGYSEEMLAWLEEQIQTAQADTPDLPIFVITHHNPKDTVYGSDSWCDPEIDNVFRKYSNVVSISGHSHYAILDERSIYQHKYTALTTQSLAYIENETGKFDPFKGQISSVPPHDDEYPMMLIMNISDTETTIQRWNVTDNKEEKADQRWTLTYPLVPEHFTYTTEKREGANQAPSMANAPRVTFDPAVPSTLREPKEGEETLPGITFRAGTDDDLVHSYRIVLRGEKEMEYTYFSDFYNGIDNMAETVRFALDQTLPAGDYQVSVYAIDSYGVESPDYAYGEITLE